MKIAKKVIFIVLMICLCLSTKVAAQTGTINYESIVVREEATTDSEPIAEGYEGETVEIIEKIDNWYKVEYKGDTGYIREDLLDVEERKNEEDKPVEKNEEQEEKQEEPKEEPQEEKKNDEEQKKEEPNNDKKEDTLNPIGEKQIASDAICRRIPCIYASKLEELKAGTKVTVKKVLNAWSLISFGENKTGWVPTKLLKDINTAEEQQEEKQETEETKQEYNPWTGYINVSAAIIREEPNTDSEIINEVERNTPIDVIGETGEWYIVSYDGYQAYIAKRLISDSVTAEEASRNQGNRNTVEEPAEVVEEYVEPVEETSSVYDETPEPVVEEVYEEPHAEVPASSVGEAVVEKAKEYLGYDYVYGGSGPYSFDCSGFTMYIYGMFGVSMGHGATMQSSEGTYVPQSELQPGDLLIFRDWDNEDIGHCGIYIGGGEFIHAANPSRGVVIDSIYSDYYGERYVSGRRVV